MWAPKFTTQRMNSGLTWAGYLLGLLFGGLMLYRMRTGQQLIDWWMTAIMLLLVTQSIFAGITMIRMRVESDR